MNSIVCCGEVLYHGAAQTSIGELRIEALLNEVAKGFAVCVPAAMSAELVSLELVSLEAG